MFSIKSCIVTGIVLFELLGWQVAEARLTGQLFYGLNAVDRSDDLDEVSSILGLSISNNFVSSKFQTDYKLESRFIFDHENNVRNEQYTGNFTGKYMFIRPSLWWNYFGNIDVIPLDTGIEIDNLRSQTLSTVSTGPTISLWKNLRGSLDLTALSSITNYSESNLDSRGEDITLKYSYPFSEIMSVSYSLDYQSVKYDDVSNAVNDFDLLAAGIVISRDTVNSNIELTLERSDVDNINNPPPQNTIKLITGYQLNSISNISMEISDSLLSAAEFNRLGDNPDNSIFRSGLIRNKRFQLGYGHVTTNTRTSFRVFTNQLENILDTIVTSDEINGAVFSFSQDVNDKLNLFIRLESTDVKILNQRSEEILARATYTRRHNKRLFSRLEFTIENDRVNNIGSNDAIIQYRITSTVF